MDPDRVAVGGVSFGATMAVNMAARFPEKIKFAVACNGTYNYPKTALEDIGYDASGKHIKSINDGENTILQLGGRPSYSRAKRDFK